MTSLEQCKKDEYDFEDFEFVDSENDFALVEEHINFMKKKANGNSIFSIFCKIIEDQGWVVVIPLRTMTTAAAGAITGTLLGGIPGLTIGLVTGAVVGYCTSLKSNNSSRSSKAKVKKSTLREVFSKMTLKQKKDLLKELLKQMKHSNVKTLVAEILKSEKIRNMALSILSDYLMKKMGICLTKL